MHVIEMPVNVEMSGRILVKCQFIKRVTQINTHVNEDARLSPIKILKMHLKL